MPAEYTEHERAELAKMRNSGRILTLKFASLGVKVSFLLKESPQSPVMDQAIEHIVMHSVVEEDEEEGEEQEQVQKKALERLFRTDHMSQRYL